jgi:hypothetical protein
MINVQQITSQLARLPDQALQQYAQMHKNDPYILSLALSESNRRKQMREGAQANAPEQPKVVDQAIQSMAAPMPEDIGIAQLPAGDMNFADGGIVAFDEGGPVERYQSGGQPPSNERVYRTQDGQYFARPLTGQTGYEGMGPTEFLKALYEDIKRKIGPGLSPADRAKAERAALAEANKRLATQGFSYEELYGAAKPTMVTDPQFRSAGAAAAPGAAAAAPGTAAPAPGTGGPRRNVGTGAPRPDAGGLELLGGPGTTAGATGTAGLPTMQSPLQMYEAALSAVPLVDPTAGMREELGKEVVRGPKERLRKRQEEIEAEGDVFAGRGERIGQREAKLKDYESTNQSLSLLNAGLAVMSTPGGLATALGKGARVGTEQYAAGLDKIRAAQERIEDAKDSLDTLRLNRADMNKKDIRSLEADVDRAQIDAKKLGIEGLMAASDLRHKQASELFKGTLEQAKAVYAGEVDLRGRRIAADASLAAARASAGAQRSLFEALGSADPNSPLRKGYEMFKQEGQIPRLYAEYTKLASDPINGAAFEQKYPTFEAFIASMGGARAPGFVTPPANATVLKPPGTR